MTQSAKAVLIFASILVPAAGQVLGPDEDPTQQPASGNRITASQQRKQLTTETSPTSKSPTLREYSDASSKQLRSHAQAKETDARIKATLEIITLATQIAGDPRVRSSKSLQKELGKLHSRLRAVQQREQREIRRRERKRSPVEKISPSQPVLAQLNRAANGPNANNNAINPATFDYSTQLIELIQRTISPNSWDVNGGLSTIRYWRPGMALVVRAPQQVHEDLSPLLGGLRRE